MKRHEHFNGMIKRFAPMNERLRHGPYQFKCHFNSICVICQYQLDSGMPLYKIFIDATVEITGMTL
jgi:hypothetical protein